MGGEAAYLCNAEVRSCWVPHVVCYCFCGDILRRPSSEIVVLALRDRFARYYVTHFSLSVCRVMFARILAVSGPLNALMPFSRSTFAKTAYGSLNILALLRFLQSWRVRFVSALSS